MLGRRHIKLRRFASNQISGLLEVYSAPLLTTFFTIHILLGLDSGGGIAAIDLGAGADVLPGHVGLRDLHRRWDGLLACSVELTRESRLIVVKQGRTSSLEAHDSRSATRRVEKGASEPLPITCSSLVFSCLRALGARSAPVDTAFSIVLAAVLSNALAA